MVSPTSGLEYRPTIYAWGILFFVVFPLIYLSGRIAGALIRLFFRILFYLIEFLTFEWLIQTVEQEVIMEDISECVPVTDVERERRRRERRKERQRERERRHRAKQNDTITIVEEEKATEDGLGSEAETTTDEGLKCTTVLREDASSGFGSTPSPSNGAALQKRHR
ncbi:unnamed protein product, partial [Mesorhabditis spiculigera]